MHTFGIEVEFHAPSDLRNKLILQGKHEQAAAVFHEYYNGMFERNDFLFHGVCTAASGMKRIIPKIADECSYQGAYTTGPLFDAGFCVAESSYDYDADVMLPSVNVWTGVHLHVSKHNLANTRVRGMAKAITATVLDWMISWRETYGWPWSQRVFSSHHLWGGVLDGDMWRYDYQRKSRYKPTVWRAQWGTYECRLLTAADLLIPPQSEHRKLLRRLAAIVDGHLPPSEQSWYRVPWCSIHNAAANRVGSKRNRGEIKYEFAPAFARIDGIWHKMDGDRLRGASVAVPSGIAAALKESGEFKHMFRPRTRALRDDATRQRKSAVLLEPSRVVGRRVSRLIGDVVEAR